MQQQCVGVAEDICVANDNGAGSCLSDLIASLRAFYDDLLPHLPVKLDEGGFRARGYERALEQARETFENVSKCAELNGYDFTTCEYIQLAVTTTDLFYRARLASIPAP